MALLGTVLAEARVPLWNLETADVGEPVVATVEIRNYREINGRPPLSFLVPLIAVTLLRNSRNQRELASPMMDLIGLAAHEIRANEDAARGLRLRERVDMDSEQLLSEDAEMAAAGILGVGLPELSDTPLKARPTKTFRAQLKAPRRGQAPFGAVSGVGNGYQAALGFFALLEHMARHAPYDAVAKPAATALVLLVELYYGDFAEQAPSFSETSALNAVLVETIHAA